MDGANSNGSREGISSHSPSNRFLYFFLPLFVDLALVI